MRRTLLALPMLAAGAGALRAQPPPVLCFAAASLQGALDSVARAWMGDTGRRIVFSFAATPALARQIAAGAPADLFAAADTEWMDWAETRGHIRPASRRTLLANRLVLIARSDHATDLAIAPGFPLRAALGESRLAIAEPNSVPAGRYARAALANLGVWDGIAARTAGAENVRAALNLVIRGESRFGIVYASDVLGEHRVRVVGTFPAQSHPPILYPFAITRRSTQPDAGHFLAYLASDAARRLFEAAGFSIPD